jgi:hypothetical protein
MLNDAFLSIVSKDCPRDSLLVRARRKGDIEKIFPEVKVKRSTNTDYLYRAVVPRLTIKTAMLGEINRITYSNFKDSVDDKPLHDAYLRCWGAMASLQETGPYASLFMSEPDPAYLRKGPLPKAARSKKRSLKKGR